MVTSYTAAPDIEVLTSNFPIPGYGLVPINAFVIKGSEPILVDTGSVVESSEFMPALRAVIDPGELRWLWAHPHGLRPHGQSASVAHGEPAAPARSRPSGPSSRSGASKTGPPYCVAPPTQAALSDSRSTAVPRRYTSTMRRVLVMSSNGFASSTTKSALLPASSVPRSSNSSNAAEF